MAENQPKAPAAKAGETLSDNSKTEDVRMSNIIAAKGNYSERVVLISSRC